VDSKRSLNNGSATMVASSDDDARLGMQATEAECEEAERVVSKAFQDVKVRDRMRLKVSTASPNDLQAMLNARLNK